MMKKHVESDEGFRRLGQVRFHKGNSYMETTIKMVTNIGNKAFADNWRIQKLCVLVTSGTSSSAVVSN